VGPVRRAGWISSLALAVAILAAQSASAADSVYWVDYNRSAIDRAGIAGGGAADIPISEPGDVIGPYGIALDPAEGKLYWANYNTNSIGVANLDGSDAHLLNTEGSEIAEPSGLAIDPGTRRIYWANSGPSGNPEPDGISYANLNGSGGGTLNTTGATISEPFSIAIDPAGGRVYWTNDFDVTDSISYANLDGSGGADLDTTGAAVNNPVGLAIDSAAHRIYWGNSVEEHSIASASIFGGEGTEFELAGLDPEGLALDTAANRIYWASEEEKQIGFSSPTGEGRGAIDTTGVELSYPAFPVLLKTPVSTAAPAIAVAPKAVALPFKSGQGAPPFVESQAETFNCSQGSWAPDLYEAFVYRAPRSFAYQWLRNERPIGGATASSYAATEVGDYACRVTATNGAGPTATESAPVNIHASFALGKPVLNRKKGTAKLAVAASGSGVVALVGRALKSKSLASGPGSAAPLSGVILVKAKGKALKELRKSGRAKVRATLEFTPTNGSPLLATKSITLRRKH
jgi:DNA-binding beta-propeller fold protein YncE